MEFRDVIKYLRTEKGWSQQELADKLQVNKMSISQYELGKRKPSFDKIEALADIFHVDMNYLLGHADYVVRMSGDETDPAGGVTVLVSVEENDLLHAWRHADKQSKRIAAYALGLENREK